VWNDSIPFQNRRDAKMGVEPSGSLPASLGSAFRQASQAAESSPSPALRRRRSGGKRTFLVESLDFRLEISLEIFDDYFLVGGIALALQPGHRISVDIDLFTRKDMDKDNVFSVLSQKYKNDFQIKNIQKAVVQMTVKEIKVDLMKYDYELIEDVYDEESVRYLGKKKT
jgi:hypothetical protein